MPDRIATSAELAEVLHVSPATVQWHARRGRIPCDLTPGGHRRYDVAEVQLALAGDGGAEVTVELGRSRRRGLGRGVAAPGSANAVLVRGLRGARPEPRPQPGPAVESPAARSALCSLVAHAKQVTLATVSP